MSRTFDVLHMYRDDGIYIVTLTVTDDDGGVRTDTLTNEVLMVEAECDQVVNGREKLVSVQA